MIYKFSSYMKTCLQNSREGKMGKINDKMETITSRWFFLCWFQHDIPMSLRNKGLVQLVKSTIFSRCFYKNLKKNFWTFYTFDKQTQIANHYFKHCAMFNLKWGESSGFPYPSIKFGITLETFHFPETVQVLSNPTPPSLRVASTPNKTNQLPLA